VLEVRERDVLWAGVKRERQRERELRETDRQTVCEREREVVWVWGGCASGETERA
jgi:hypothetical protein